MPPPAMLKLAFIAPPSGSRHIVGILALRGIPAVVVVAVLLYTVAMGHEVAVVAEKTLPTFLAVAALAVPPVWPSGSRGPKE